MKLRVRIRALPGDSQLLLAGLGGKKVSDEAEVDEGVAWQYVQSGILQLVHPVPAPALGTLRYLQRQIDLRDPAAAAALVHIDFDRVCGAIAPPPFGGSLCDSIEHYLSAMPVAVTLAIVPRIIDLREFRRSARGWLWASSSEDDLASWYQRSAQMSWAAEALRRWVHALDTSELPVDGLPLDDDASAEPRPIPRQWWRRQNAAIDCQNNSAGILRANSVHRGFLSGPEVLLFSPPEEDLTPQWVELTVARPRDQPIAAPAGGKADSPAAGVRRFRGDKQKVWEAVQRRGAPDYNGPRGTLQRYVDDIAAETGANPHTVGHYIEKRTELRPYIEELGQSRSSQSG